MSRMQWIKKYKSIPVQVRASAWFLICAFLQKGISAITTPIFTRLLTTTEYGQYSVFNSWMNIATVFVSLNLSSGVFTQGLVKFEGTRKRFVSSFQGLCLTLVLVWTVIYLLFCNFWNRIFELTTVQMLAMLLMIWTSTAVSFWSVEQRVDLKYRRLVLVTVSMSIAKPVIGIILVVHATDKVTVRILGLAFVELIVCVGCFCVQMWRGKTFFDWKIWKYALLFNIPLIPHYLSTTVLNSADRIMISKMIGEDAAGIYSLAYSVSLIMTMFNTALLQTIEPWLYQKIKAKQMDALPKVAYPAFVLIAGINIVLIAFAPEVVAIFAPAEYYDAIWIIPPVAISGYFTFAYTFFAVFEFYYEKTGYISAATMVGAVLNILLNYVFIRLFGYYAAGYTTLFCYILYAVFHYWFMTRVCREYMGNVKVYNIKILLGITGVFMMAGFFFLLTYENVVLRYGLVGVLAVCMIVLRKRIVYAMKQIILIRSRKDAGRVDK